MLWALWAHMVGAGRWRGSIRRPARSSLHRTPYPREMGFRALARTHARRADRARRHQLAQPPLRDAARHRAPHGRTVPRRARHRSVRSGPGSGAHDAAAARSARAGRLLSCSCGPADDGAGAVVHGARSADGRREVGRLESGFVRVAREARRAARPALRVRAASGT